MNKPTPKKPEDSAGASGARRHRLPAEPACPKLSQVRVLLEEAEAKRGFLIELPWMSTDGKNFILTVQWDSNLKDPVWTLYEDTDGGSKVVWTQPFAAQDLEFMYDILSMSAGSTGGAGIPEELRMQPSGYEEAAKKEEEPAPTFDSYGAPSLSPFASPASPPFAAPGGAPGFGGFPGSAGASFTNLPSLQPTPPQPVYPPLQPQQPPYPQQQPQGYPQQPQGYPPQQQGYPQQQQGYPPQQTPYPGYPPQQAPPGYGQNPYQQPPAPMQQPMQYGQQGGYNTMPPMQTPMTPAPSYGAELNEPKIRVDYHLIDKGANILLGSLLQEAGLISAPTLEAALKLQEMVRDEKMTPDKAPEVLKRLHAMGSSIDQYLTKGDLDKTSAAARAKSDPQPAKSQPAAAPAGGGAAKPGGRDLKGAFDLLQKAQLLTENDLVTADNVRKKHGGDLIKILEAAGKCNGKTVDAACTSLPLIREGLMKIEQVIMALNYCERMRVTFDEALDEMGWQNPRKIRTDLPL
ncbi:MAG: hypothetical protein KGS72_02620 [Cyanobacteria bacterium REEB67]|nr:hypothetical protein [Cyanobacteria bacterium REEB67]